MSNASLCPTFHASAYLSERLVLVSGVGSLVGFASILNNALLAHILFVHLRAWHNNLVFLAVNAVLDVAIAVSYVLVFPVLYAAEASESFRVYDAWHVYVRAVFVLAQASAPLPRHAPCCAGVHVVLVVHDRARLDRALLERHPAAQGGPPRRLARRLPPHEGASWSAPTSPVKVSMMWETEVEWRDDCHGFQRARIKQTQLVSAPNASLNAPAKMHAATILDLLAGAD